VQLQTWDLNANLYDGASTAGPVPTLFSDDQQATIDALVADPAQAHKDVVKINRYNISNTITRNQTILYTTLSYSLNCFFSIFVMPEVIKAASCGSIIKKPRLDNLYSWYSIKPTQHFILTFFQIPREGTGIQKFKRSRWSASDESPPKKKKTDTDSGTAHFAFFPIHNL
jgi:hypothetical protein